MADAGTTLAINIVALAENAATQFRIFILDLALRFSTFLFAVVRKGHAGTFS
jgi:hypothetical protein